MMKKLVIFSMAACLVWLVCVVHCTPTEHHGKGGVKKPKPLSDEPHTLDDGEHNTEYDHEAFLGEEEAAEFDSLPPEESKRRLRIICKKIDTDSDGYITHEELKKWVEHVSHSYISESVKEYLPEHDTNNDGKISWNEYKDATYGDAEDDEEYDPSRGLSFTQAIDRDEKKFKFCDQDNDGLLDKEEFMAFLHPEEFEHTKNLHVDETFEDMDKDKDGSISLEEYIEDIWPSADREENEEEPEWVQDEIEQFKNHRDTDGDKKLNKRELSEWISPDDYDGAEAEATHLIHHADDNKDEKLSIDEVVENYELFVGSQATDFGNYLNRHDEF